jgi:Ni,Fe-hydrogenase III component G
LKYYKEGEINQETTKDNLEIQERTRVSKEVANYLYNQDKHGVLIVILLTGNELLELENNFFVVMCLFLVQMQVRVRVLKEVSIPQKSKVGG